MPLCSGSSLYIIGQRTPEVPCSHLHGLNVRSVWLCHQLWNVCTRKLVGNIESKWFLFRRSSISSYRLNLFGLLYFIWTWKSSHFKVCIFIFGTIKDVIFVSSNHLAAWTISVSAVALNRCGKILGRDWLIHLLVSQYRRRRPFQLFILCSVLACVCWVIQIILAWNILSSDRHLGLYRCRRLPKIILDDFRF